MSMKTLTDDAEYRAAVADQADATRVDHAGFAVGDTVRVGGAQKLWTIVSFFATHFDGEHAHLEPAEGYTRSSAALGRLTRVVAS